MSSVAVNITASPLYAVIDLGSNSFHMLITRVVSNSVQTIDKVKRKVRLASGLDSENTLSLEAIERGLTCLRFFAERLQDFPAEPAFAKTQYLTGESSVVNLSLAETSTTNIENENSDKKKAIKRQASLQDIAARMNKTSLLALTH